ncbi:hypothetical protein ACQEVX_30855 [Streptomyces syringium]|uniref:hypothetical protein n=1 Tax=Streptomyces syringium TaxID=76729 RepID=UPI003D937E7D
MNAQAVRTPRPRHVGALARQRRRTALLSVAVLALLVVLLALGLSTGEVPVAPWTRCVPWPASGTPAR